MTSLCFRKPIFHQPKSSKSLVIIPSAWTGLSVDKALFPPVLITLVVVSLTLIHSDLDFSPVSVSSLSSQDPYSDYTCVKVLLSNHSPLQFLNLYSPPIRNSLLILAPGPSILTSFLTPLTLSSSETSMLATHVGQTHPPNPLGNDLIRWITSSGLELLNDPASPTLLHHSTGNRSSPDILLAPASLTPHCEWRTLHGLGSDRLPIEIVLPLFPVRHQTHVPPNSITKKPVGIFTNLILLSTFSLLILMHSTSTRLPTPFPYS